MDGPWYIDSKPPHTAVSASAVTLTTTLQLLCPGAFIPQFPSNYFGYIGKAVRCRFFGQCTSGTTPGSLTFNLMWGPATANTGTTVAGVAVGWAASSANYSFWFEFVVRCRALGASGSLFGGGWGFIQNTGTFMVSPTSPAAVTVDLTQNYFLMPQVSRSGSTAETIQLHDAIYEAVN